MDSMAIADVIAGLSLIASGVAIWLSIRGSQQRSIWERQQERRQIAFTQPDLVPTGSTIQALGGTPYQLATEGEQSVGLHNEGNSTPSDVQLVLFPTAKYVVPGSQPPMYVYGLGGKYWEGRVDVSPPPDGSCWVTLLSNGNPLQGEMQVIKGLTLFAPPQPDTGATGIRAPFFFARLTLTYRDRSGRVLASAFDMGAETRDWYKVAGPVEVEHDLHDLHDLANNAGLPVELPSGTQDHK